MPKSDVQNLIKTILDKFKKSDMYIIDNFSKSITEYAFRSGPIEDMHANGQLSQDDMMKLNKYMVNKIAGLLYMISKDEWEKVLKVMGFYATLAYGWDKAELDIKDFEIIDDAKIVH